MDNSWFKIEQNIKEDIDWMSCNSISFINQGQKNMQIYMYLRYVQE